MKSKHSTASALQARVEVHLTRLDVNFETRVTSPPETDLPRARPPHRVRRLAESIAARKFLRGLLAIRLGIREQAVEILQEPNEKPYLKGDEIEFSLSHRDGWCAVALSEDCPVGVDIERMDPFAGMEGVVAEFFPPRARAEFTTAPAEERLQVFFHWWTRIEAAVKAVGKGLDTAAFGVDATFQLSCEPVTGLVLAVAVQSDHLPFVDWHVLGRSGNIILRDELAFARV